MQTKFAYNKKHRYFFVGIYCNKPITKNREAKLKSHEKALRRAQK